MNGQNNTFHSNQDPKQLPKRSGQSMSDFKEEKPLPNEIHKQENNPLNSINSEKMNQNSTNAKIDRLGRSNHLIHGSDNVDSTPINAGMILKEHPQLNLQTEKEEQPSFSKAMIREMKNQPDAFLNQENSTVEEIKPLEEEKSEYFNTEDTSGAKKTVKKIFMGIIIVGILVELIVLLVGTISKNTKVTLVTCTNSNQYDYYKATVKSKRTYSLRQGKIFKLQEERVYVFANSTDYLDYKSKYSNPVYTDIKGRTIMTSINDDTLTYTEKFIYDYQTLLKNNKNTSSDEKVITIETGNSDDVITLVNTSVEGIKDYHKETYQCK